MELKLAFTGFSSEASMQYLFDEGINAVIPGNQFRKRNPVFAESELYNKQKGLRKKTRKDKAKTNMAIPCSEFKVNLESNTCICRAGKELKFLGDDYEEARGTYSRLRGRVKGLSNMPASRALHEKPCKRKGQASVIFE